VVDAITFSESTHSFPRIKASLTVHAFVYGDVSTPTAPAATTPTGTTTGTTATTTEPTTTATSPDTPPVGASATPAVTP